MPGFQYSRFQRAPLPLPSPSGARGGDELVALVARRLHGLAPARRAEVVQALLLVAVPVTVAVMVMRV